MLTRVRIRGFKAIKDSGAIDLGGLKLLIGRNGTGKSSLIEALQWLQEATVAGLEEATDSRFGVFEEICNRRAETIRLNLTLGSGSNEVRYDLAVKRGPGHRPIVAHESCLEGRTSGTTETVVTRAGKRGPAVRSVRGGYPVRDGDALALATVAHTKASGAERLRVFLKKAVFLRLSPTGMAQKARLRRRARGPVLDEEGRGLVALLAAMTAKERDWVSRHVARVISGVVGIAVHRTGEDEGRFGAAERMVSRGGRKVHFIEAQLLSEGTRRLTAIFALLAVRPRPSLIAIEEIENGLDPWTLTYVFQALREAAEDGVQVVLTTHSPFLLDNVQPADVIHVTRQDGDTRFRPIAGYRDVVRYKGALSPGAMYISEFLKDAAK